MLNLNSYLWHPECYKSILRDAKTSTAMSFNFQRVSQESFEVLSVDGYMGNGECRKLEAELERLLQQGRRRVIIDFVALTFITSASLVRMTRQMRRFQRQDAELKIAGLPPFAARLIKTVRLERVLKPESDLAEAIRSLSPTDPFTTKKEKLPARQRKQPQHGRGFACCLKH
jgi:anti-anti-sigma factor